MVNLGSPYQGYLYAYPHKTAYRPLDPRPRLADVWRGEDTTSLFLYVHVPFCEMRCGFCNLFTRANPPHEQVSAYLAQLARQARRVADAIPGAGYARAAIGGGTPTYLTAGELTQLFDLLERTTGLGRVPLSVETSPATATPDRLAVLAERGATRVSIGVQSFLDSEAHAAGRPQRRAEVERALDTIRAAGPADLNIDLIYGIPGQTRATWDESLNTALRWNPEELYLYPLYVRPLTGLGRRGGDEPDPAWDAQRLDLYRHAVQRLTDAGYEQLSMRQFRRAETRPAEASRAAVQRLEGRRAEARGAEARGAEARGAEARGVEGRDGEARGGEGRGGEGRSGEGRDREGRDRDGRSGDGGGAEARDGEARRGKVDDYCCQDDGMVGLGCGARSYTTALHYSFDYAVSVRQVRGILDDYLARPESDFDVAEVGFALDAQEQRRRWLLKSLLRAEGLDAAAYRARFGTAADDDFPALERLRAAGYAEGHRLTADGLAHSDAIGPWLVSADVRAAMAGHVTR
ncbi:STM4012 family radical SAM protein [Dactylosporangium sp. CS-033363]|uniref:STM4012 family radical SAM protein n=1 Tax=Dactylosporangium sp. CS-033363 TaxID=3239935 RepID=UPI003D92D340